MVFSASTYENFVSEKSSSQTRLFAPYLGSRDDFDLIIIGSGFGGGVLADDLAERIGQQKRILVLEAGSYLYPTHIYNVCRFPNANVAKNFACKTFSQEGNEGSEDYIHERPQLNFGGRSIWWSGLIPHIQPWELQFFPDKVRQDLQNGLLDKAGASMNESISMGTVAQGIVERFKQGPLAEDFIIAQTPRALHQPYLNPNGTPKEAYFTEPTGVFNTAELLINQVGLSPGVSQGDGPGLHLLLNKFVEGVDQINDGHLKYRVNSTDTIDGKPRSFRAKTVILCGGSIESPKLLQRSPIYSNLAPAVKSLVGNGLTDHPTTSELTSFISHMGDLFIPRHAHAKIILYSKGNKGPNKETRYPFNVEININHEYWHLRENDPSEPGAHNVEGDSRIDFKFSFGNPVYGGNHMDLSAANYVPNMQFRNLSRSSHLADSRFPALAGWHKSVDEIWAVLNEVSYKVCSQFSLNGQPARPAGEAWFGKEGKGFGIGTVHHAACSLRMPFRWTFDREFEPDSVVDEDLQVRGMDGLYVCDMSVMPFSSAANPVRTLAALGLRLSERLAARV
ncbi:hypothetical protein B0T25DRAFT_629561 [Lasiosphaeria hispida]|uniref:Glucose-methanol-choline oxidoreductase C-terminal domain-containing protein n=1 Tax=Lasiosphaeria hispida TaxID=260671 RepID=A0AAJ0HSK1_9PEZI|nr:hypothetical protein B0T25DRAFT_629561 [Lasiosphaeria hispida]